MGTTHGTEELGLCSHGLACQAGALILLVQVYQLSHSTHYVYEKQSKEEREAKTPKNYLGNGKEFVFNGGTTASAPVTTDMDDEELPFQGELK